MTYRGLLVKDLGIAVRWTQSDAIEITMSEARDVATAATLLKDLFNSVESALHTILPSALLEHSALINGQPIPLVHTDELKVQSLPLPLISRLLCRHLDPKNCFGQDWCLLAVKLNLYDRLLPKLAGNSTAPLPSTTHALLKEWLFSAPNTTVPQLLRGLDEIERGDVADLVRKFLPVSENIFGLAREGGGQASSPASPSDKALSSSMSSSLLSR